MIAHVIQALLSKAKMSLAIAGGVALACVSFSSGLASAACLPPSPASYPGWYPASIQNPTWNGKFVPNLSTNKVDVRQNDGSKLFVSSISSITSSCTSTTGWIQFKVNGLGDGNTWVKYEKDPKYTYGFKTQVLWYGKIYERTK